MSRRAPEQNLVDSFVEAIRAHPDPTYKLHTLHNDKCRSKRFADVEYSSHSGARWAVEAKSDDSKDKYNTVHKIFGELLKETGRANRAECKYGLLLPESARTFYSESFQAIAREKYIQFGALIPVSAVFLVGASGLCVLSWEDLHPLPGQRSASAA